MNCFQFGNTGKFSRSWLNLCAVSIILLINVRVNWAQDYTDYTDDTSSYTSDDDDQLLFVAMVSQTNARDVDADITEMICDPTRFIGMATVLRSARTVLTHIKTIIGPKDRVH